MPIQNPLLTTIQLKPHMTIIFLELISVYPSPAHLTLKMTQKPFSPPPSLPLRSTTKAVENIVYQMHLLSENSPLIRMPMGGQHITKLRRFHLLNINSLAQQLLYPQRSLFMRSLLLILIIGYIRMHLQEIKLALITSARSIPMPISSPLTNGIIKVLVQDQKKEACSAPSKHVHGKESQVQALAYPHLSAPMRTVTLFQTFTLTLSKSKTFLKRLKREPTTISPMTSPSETLFSKNYPSISLTYHSPIHNSQIGTNQASYMLTSSHQRKHF